MLFAKIIAKVQMLKGGIFIQNFNVRLNGNKVSVHVREGAADGVRDLDLDEFRLAKLLKTIEDFKDISIDHEFVVQDNDISKIAIVCHKVAENKLEIFCMVDLENIYKV